MRLIPTPTPRWPDLLCAYHAGDRILLTSKLFSAHVGPSAAGGSREDPFDAGGWEAYEPDWKFFFECMLAPVARQASGEWAHIHLELSVWSNLALELPNSWVLNRARAKLGSSRQLLAFAYVLAFAEGSRTYAFVKDAE